MTSTLFNEESDTYYDSVYSKSLRYKHPPKHPDLKHYYPSWKSACDYIKLNEIKLVIDIGCGPGHLPLTMRDENLDVEYIGIDFSSVAIKQARQRIADSNYQFIIGKAEEVDYKELISSKKYKKDEILFTSFEFLEHVEQDLKIISRLPSDIHICFSVPNYPCKGHVRFFRNTKSIVDRYKKYLTINHYKKTVWKEWFEYSLKTGKSKKQIQTNVIFIFCGRTK